MLTAERVAHVNRIKGLLFASNWVIGIEGDGEAAGIKGDAAESVTFTDPRTGTLNTVTRSGPRHCARMSANRIRIREADLRESVGGLGVATGDLSDSVRIDRSDRITSFRSLKSALHRLQFCPKQADDQEDEVPQISACATEVKPIPNFSKVQDA